MKSKIVIILSAAILLTFLLCACTYRSGAFLKLKESNGDDQWNASWSSFNGSIWRNISLEEGIHEFSVDITTESGDLGLSVKDQNRKDYYTAEKLESSSFTVQIEGRDKVTIRFEGNKHAGGFKVSWD